jgi:predicted GTPase
MIPTQPIGQDAFVDLTDDGGLPEIQEAELLVDYGDQGLSAVATASVVVMVLDYRRLESDGGY